MVWLVVIGVLGLMLGWIVRGWSSPNRRDLAEYDERAQRAERRLRSVVVERDNEHASVLTLRAALRSERQLLDGVAHQSGVDPEAFRKIISKEYLGRELVVSPASLVDFDFGTNRAAEAEVASLQRLLRARDEQLAEAREQIHRIRADVESLALAGQTAANSAAGVALPESGVRAEAEPPSSGVSEATLDVRDDPAVIDLCDAERSGQRSAAQRSNAHRSNEHRPNEHRPNEHRPNEHRPGAPRPSAHRPSARRPAAQTTAVGSTTEQPTPDRPVTTDAPISAERLRFLEDRAASAGMLVEEVASLRARLADTAVANDEIRARIEYRRSLDAELGEIVAKLESFRRRAVAEKAPTAPDEDPDPVL